MDAGARDTARQQPRVIAGVTDLIAYSPSRYQLITRGVWAGVTSGVPLKHVCTHANSSVGQTQG